MRASADGGASPPHCPRAPKDVFDEGPPIKLPRFLSTVFGRSREGLDDLLSGPIQGELLGTDQLAEKARTVAAQQRISEHARGPWEAKLLDRLSQTRRILHDTWKRVSEGADRDVDVGPAGEWLLDNFHVVQEHIREVHETLPRGYYRELPALEGGHLAGYPRVYELAISLISHSEGRVDLDNLDLFVTAFQTVAPLSIGELWAVPAMLRLALIESVRRMALRTVQRMDEIEKADEWAARIEEASERGAIHVTAVLQDFVGDPPPLTPVFVSRFLHQLRLTRGSYAPLAQIEQWIGDRALGAEAATARSTQHLALTQVMMAHSITSLRTIGHLDWASFVERQSAMEAVLREDPAAEYERMTFATRDRYRHVVERIARRTGRGEVDVARMAVERAREHEGRDERAALRSHVGYYLVDEGLAELEKAAGYRAKPSEALHRWVLRHPDFVLGGGIAAATLGALAAVLWLAGSDARTAWPLVILLAFFPALDLAVSLVNQLITAWLPPRTLPRLDLRERGGIPAEFRTAVVVPTLFGSVEAVAEALEHLEIQFLANREPNLHFAVLGDFTDAASETVEGDAAILAAAVEGVRALNARYAPASADAFYLFLRPRRWNPQQGVWMGWERKRGKLAEFNRFLRSAKREGFSTIEGNVSALRGVRYVITLDADTVLPPHAANDLVGAIAHPLNRAIHDPARGRVVRGYGILQPRVGVSLPSAHRSHFASIQSGHPGVDPYTTAVSDVYQDLYGEGSFTGKGIYDVETFEHATHGRFPENTLLSHDLIEGSYARAGLATDISVYDDYPTRYLTWTRRKHRWIRGDWQLLDWLTSRVAGPDGPEPNRLRALSRWKIVDNLRRSVVEIAQLLFLVLGWTLMPGSPLRWTALGVAVIASPWIISLLLALRPPGDKSWRAYYAAVGRDAVTSAQQVGLALTFLPHQAWVSADAILRTLWRLFVSHRHLLEWQTMSRTESSLPDAPGALWRAMWPSVALAAGSALLLTVQALLGALTFPIWRVALAAGPLLLLWAIAPAIAFALDAPAIPARQQLSAAQREDALRLALLHWRFFDQFVNEDTHWLAPDNFQEDPVPVVAMRTSPTNIGLQLLAIGSAYDLGFLSAAAMTERLELAFRSLERMQRFRGHFFNWYDLNDLHVLEPAYVSTVDSGNLAGHLMAVRQACLGARGRPASDPRVGAALHTALRLAVERLELLYSDAAPKPTGGFNGVAAAAAHLKTARAALATDDDEPVSDDVFADMEAALAAARASLAEATGPSEAFAPALKWIDWGLERIRQHAASHAISAAELDARLEAIADRASDWVTEMDFGFLFDRQRELFSIGYRHRDHALDSSFYDLFASEARLASFVAIAKHDVPLMHWFRLGRTLTHASGETALVSWSGSMFEYLMPALVMRSFPFTILDATYHGALRRQIAYGAERGVPWGVSESAYNVRDRDLTYQYRAFGVPDLALKRGLGRDLVIAPYATALAVLVDPQRALANLAVVEEKGALGAYGFRDALDYTRPDPGRRYAIVGNYMAHHIGMTLVALTNALHAQVWQERFHADPLVRSAELLLHERIPRKLVFQEPQAQSADGALPDPETDSPAVREFEEPDTPRPHIALLGRRPYTIMLSHAGSGYSRYDDLAVTRWRADGTLDSTGQFCYLKDVSRGRAWSAAHQPLCIPADRYRALLATDRVTFLRTDGDIETRTEIAVVPEDAAEVRRVTVTNRAHEPREIELTSYGEIVLGSADGDRAHPAFANVFVETEYHEWCTAITAMRRPRSTSDPSLWCVHVVDSGKDRAGPVTCETDRARFLGRGNTTRDPVALAVDGPMSGTTGAVLDPIFSLRTRVRLEPGQSASASFTTLVAETRERAFELAGRYHDPHAAARALDLAWTSQQVELRELGLTPTDAAVFQELAGVLLFPHARLRASQAEQRRNTGAQPLLWSAGVSGDWPIVLATIDSVDGLPTLRQLFAAHHYWRRRGMTVDLVIINTQPSSYQQELQERIREAAFAANDAETDRPGGVFLRRRDALAADVLLMLEATARLNLRCVGRSLAHALDAAGAAGPVRDGEPAVASEAILPALPSLLRRRTLPPPAATLPPAPRPSPAIEPPDRVSAFEHNRSLDVTFDNGIGGLTPAGDYRMRIRSSRLPPAPWVNVVANPHGGFVVSERGTGFSWADSSYFYRLTPWHNDPVSDPASDVVYLRDVDTGRVWTPTPAPVGHDIPFDVTHSAGTSVFEAEHDGITSRFAVSMADDEAVKLSVLRLTNGDGGPRRIEVTAFVEWTLGAQREHTRHQVRTTFDAEHAAILAQNFFDPQYADQVAFLALSEAVTSHTGDRCAFLGRNGTVEDPVALHTRDLGGHTGVGLDPCGALRCTIELAPGEARELVVILGATRGLDDARRGVAQYRDVTVATDSATKSVRAWDERLSVVTVRTPEPAFDAIVNRWALYQALSCRMWARSALYQSSGAFGFRDQLQDVMAFLYAEPALAREHILRATARQFVEGDVQHWWHPQSGRGVRTRFSDDLVWLPWAVSHYLDVTGDASVLDEVVPFLSMRPLQEHEHEVYDLPQVSDEEASVYEHCLRALRTAATVGPHGLPLIGGGDWNDGMNRVGVEGKGESVWLAWFLTFTLRAFAGHAAERGDHATAVDLMARADAYIEAVETHAWDGAWYRRAYFDDGTPLGSRTNRECRIDSIAQSWSVISGEGSPDRQRQAMQSFEQHLVRGEARVLLLLTPPFDTTPHDPGYIKGYLPGVRENGAQYTHAALWAVLATALRGDGDRAFELYQMLNPLTHAGTAAGVDTYKVEPYAIAADVYTAAGHVGRGGWTWYTGSAAWMYRVGLEAILGFTRRGDTLRIEPRVPAAWRAFSIEYRFGATLYAITVRLPGETRSDRAEVRLDGTVLGEPAIPLVDDGVRHEVVVTYGSPA